MKKWIAIAFACSVSLTALANKKDDGETRSASVTVEISSSTLINIQAKHTELVVETWDQPQIVVEAVVRYDGKITDRMQRFLDEFEDNVKANVKKETGEVLIDTDLNLPNKVQIGGKHVGIQISYGDDELKLSYRVKAPGDNKYVINNSYKDVKLIGRFKEVELKQYSGDLEAGVIEEGIFNLKYGKAYFKAINEAEMEIYEQELDAEMIGVLELNAKYSNLDLEQVDQLEATSYESNYQFGSIDELTGNFKYGEVEVDQTLGSAEMECYEMEYEFNEVEDLRLTSSKYSKFEMNIAHSVRFDKSYEDETTIRSLGSFKSIESKYGNHKIESLRSNFELYAYEDEVEIEQLQDGVSEITIDGKYIDAAIDIGNASFIFKSNVKYGKVNYNESDLDVKRYIKDGDQLEIEAHSKTQSANMISMNVTGYEIDVELTN